jgi:ubiquinone/menaquinone biosynthesis C-methylase UbiE
MVKIPGFVRNDLSLIEKEYLEADKKNIRRTKNIGLIPIKRYRKGGKVSYAEWGHVIGIFQTLMYQNLEQKTGNQILDIGCGTGLLGIAADPFVSEGGLYTGVDVMTDDIDFCKQHYPNDKYKFIHLDVHNASYADEQKANPVKWDLEDNSFELATALSVWTHFNEEDAIFYLKEVERVLKPGGKAIITFFRLDEHYEKSLEKRSKTDELSRYNNTPQNRWFYTKKAYNSDEWYTTEWANVPEDAIGITEKGWEQMLAATNLKVAHYYPGNWKEMPGAYFQDVVIFSK